MRKKRIIIRPSSSHFLIYLPLFLRSLSVNTHKISWKICSVVPGKKGCQEIRQVYPTAALVCSTFSRTQKNWMAFQLAVHEFGVWSPRDPQTERCLCSVTDRESLYNWRRLYPLPIICVCNILFLLWEVPAEIRTNWRVGYVFKISRHASCQTELSRSYPDCGAPRAVGRVMLSVTWMMGRRARHGQVPE
jgi:hypothetical protein